MSARDFLANIAVILVAMGVGALIEAVVPMFAAGAWTRGRRAANLGLTALTFLSNWLLASVAAVIALAVQPTGVMSRIGWPTWVEIVVGIVVLDFSIGYLSHRIMHLWPAMWRFHQIHHSDPFVDVTTTFRTHPVETLWRFLFSVVPVWVLGIPSQAVVIQRHLSTRYSHELSGGEQQRGALARALVAHPRLVLLDEPLSNLDPGLRAQLRDELARVRAAVSSTMIYVTHDTDDVAIADRIVRMAGGRLSAMSSR